MNRRTALSTLAVGGFVGVAGCLGNIRIGGDDEQAARDRPDPELNREVETEGVEDGSRSQFQWGPTHAGCREDAGPTDDVDVFWRRTPYRYDHSQPVVVGDRVYVSFSGTLFRLDLATGEVRWSTEVGHDGSSTPAVRDGIAYVTVWNGGGETDRGLAAVDAESGEVRWRRLTDTEITTAPTVTDDGVFVGGGYETQTVAAFDYDGAERWRNDLGEYASAPAVADGTVVYGAGGPRVVAYDAASGEELWTADVDGDATATPTVADGRVLIGTRASTLYALDLADGTVEWTEDLAGPVRRSVAVAGDTAVVPTELGLVAVGDGGERLWSDDEVTGATAPMVADGVAYLGDGRTVRAIAVEDGTERWSFRTRERTYTDVLLQGVRAAPTVVDGVVLAATHAGDVYALGET
ncbi:PQQ-binding-like beta-propeller repeat protein [Halorubrum sp. Atlit-28R]|uniref:outer membrane protein assembly factor BamB family protein n=1 Tax=Halorubrum sp. Atlit-28R TaxID=2282129 RepID=UPI000EF256F4|nr:PQQ-binding-like beta-propeller repeat protein [Halorubrum sp. Atlit-28R]RLM52037.1 Pyrrolo-quinoline quinone [Halorubrum sp. Atlit-28R]